jgi:hypothetical protein
MAKVVRKGGVGIEKVKHAAAELDKLKAFAGWLESAMYDDGTPVAGVAAVHEYGSPSRNIPPRPFLRTATEEQKQEWIRLLKQGAKAVLNGKLSANDVMEQLGLKVAADIKNSIKSVTSPTLKISTIRNKQRKMANGSKVGKLDKPLEETGLMIATVTHEVRK